jgi:uncharacterized membrane-anchored protein
VIRKLKKQRIEPIFGTIVKDMKTKRLVQRVVPGQIAVIAHENLDEMAARSLLDCKVKAVVNIHPTMNGKYPTMGPLLLQQAGIPIYQLEPALWSLIEEGDMVCIEDQWLFIADRSYPLQRFDEAMREAYLRLAYQNMEEELRTFIDNTLSYAQKEKEFVLKPLPAPIIRTSMAGRHVVVVVRGCGYKEDLFAIRSYIDDYRPVLIGVDGGADALLEHGLKPDLIIGDMDSISDGALMSGSEIIVHGYSDGRAPGLERVRRLGVEASILPSPGTSEDVAMLLAYDQNAELIVTLGTHTHMIDFLEKGRKGMASTVLVRMKIGPKLIDAKGVNKLYQRKPNWRTFTALGIAAGVPMASMVFVNPGFRNMMQMLWFNFKTFVW